LSCIVLATIFSFLLRKTTKQKALPFTIEDLWGGIILGFLVGLFTENFLSYLEKFIP